jgi:hypothetical protein
MVKQKLETYLTSARLESQTPSKSASQATVTDLELSNDFANLFSKQSDYKNSIEIIHHLHTCKKS